MEHNESNKIEVTPEIFDALREVFPDLEGVVDAPKMNRETRRKQARLMKRAMKRIVNANNL